jgi:hypothetical protein
MVTTGIRRAPARNPRRRQTYNDVPAAIAAAPRRRRRSSRGTAREESRAMRSAFGLLLALLLLLIPRATEAASVEKPVSSRCGRHVVETGRGPVRLDGRVLSATGADVRILVAPAWRRGCSAVAWVDLRGTERHLMVVPSIGAGAEMLSWTLPPTIGDERIFWVGRNRIAVGVAMLQPRAMANWSNPRPAARRKSPRSPSV